MARTGGRLGHFGIGLSPNSNSNSDSNFNFKLEFLCWWRLGLVFDWISALLAFVWSAKPDFKPESHIEIQFKRL